MFQDYLGAKAAGLQAIMVDRFSWDSYKQLNLYLIRWGQFCPDCPPEDMVTDVREVIDKYTQK